MQVLTHPAQPARFHERELGHAAAGLRQHIQGKRLHAELGVVVVHRHGLHDLGAHGLQRA
ncbi:hypothetical protein [Luteibacter pinisoli]|uniref:hypothetical protein n=1 Tax=Luteibacter pinisoli TaxID=2589080 RepID=UPI001476E88C